MYFILTIDFFCIYALKVISKDDIVDLFFAPTYVTNRIYPG